MKDDLFDKLRKLQQKKAMEIKKFDDMPDMTMKDGKFEKLDMEKFKTESLAKLKDEFRNRGEKVPDMKVVGVTLHVLMCNPDNREQIAHTQIVAWNKDAGDPRLYLGADSRTESCGDGKCDDKCDSNCKNEDDGENQPYKANKYNGNMYG